MGTTPRNRDWPEGARRALVVGASAYAARSGRGPLLDVPRDATKVSEALAAMGDFRTRRVDDPESHALKREIAEFLADAPAGSHIVLYFAGHGARTPDDKDVLLVGVDGGGVTGTQLASAMLASEATDILAVLDCCYGGRVAFEAADFAPRSIASNRTVHVVTTRADQEAEGGRQGGELTRALLHAFEGGKTNAAGHVTLESVEAEIREWFRGRGGQSPSFNGPINTDFPLVWREPARSAMEDEPVSVPEWVVRGELLPPEWRITWGEEKEKPSDGVLWLYHDAVAPKFDHCTSNAFWNKKLAAFGSDRAFPLDPGEIRLRKGAVLDEIWTLWMLAWRESGRELPAEWADMCAYCCDVRHGSATDKLVPPEHRVRVIFRIIAKEHRASDEAFLDAALRLCRYVGAQLVAGRKIGSDDLLGGVPAFARYVAQAERDRARYTEDKRSARRFVASLPSGRRPHLIVLDRPESSVFSMWTRCDPEVPGESAGEEGYRLLLVRWKDDDAKVVLSSDPDNPDELDFLLPGLSALENARRGGDGVDWVFPKGDHTQLAPPKAGSDWGTALSLDEIVAHL